MSATAIRLSCLSALLWVGCTASLPEGVYGCVDDGDCPEGWACRDDRCFSSADARDGGPADAATDAGTDASLDGGPGCPIGDGGSIANGEPDPDNPCRVCDGAAGELVEAEEGSACPSGVCRGAAGGRACCTECWDGAACATPPPASCGGGMLCTESCPASTACIGRCCGLRVAAIGLGRRHGCMVTNDSVAGGRLFCWGEGARGQLGTSDSATRPTPVQVGSDADWSEVSAGGDASGAHHTCALRRGGELWCWGANPQGQLGLGDRAARDVPTQVGTGADWLRVSAADSGTCGIKRDGTLWCWGQDHVAATSTPTPTQLGTDSDWSALDCGGRHCCGLRGSSLFCWGRGEMGQLGQGDGAGSATPVAIPGSWDSVSAGTDHACALQAGDRSLWCWGNGAGGRIGDGGDINRLSPVAITLPGETGAVSAGDDATCALVLTAGSELYCWGNLPRYGFGAAESGVPVAVAEEVVPTRGDVFVGGGSACVRLPDETRVCWGADALVGDGESGPARGPIAPCVP